MYCLSFSPKAGSMCHNIAKTMHETLLKCPISTTFKIKYWKSPKTKGVKHFGMKPNPKKCPKTYDPHSALHPSVPPLVGSPAVGFLIVAALATLLPFAEVVSLLRCVLGATLSSRRCLETPKKHNNGAPVWNKRSCKLASMPVISAKSSPSSTSGTLIQEWSKKKNFLCIFTYMITRLKTWCRPFFSM